MTIKMELTQFTVSWIDRENGGKREYILYAKDQEHARQQVCAPPDAEVKQSFLTKKDLERILLVKR